MRICRLISLLVLGACAPGVVTTPQPVTVTAEETAALIQLMQNEDTRTFDVAGFDRLYSSASPLVRAQTVLAAGRIGHREAGPLLLRALQDPAQAVRANAAFSLGELGDSAANIVAGLAALTATNDSAAVEAVHALGKIGGAAARMHVEAVLKNNKSGDKLREALLAIWKFPRTAATSQLVVPFTRSGDPEIRWRAAYALVRPVPDPANAATFQALLRDPNALVRSFAVRGLRAVTADSADARSVSANLLLAALADPDAHVRVSAVTVLGGYRTLEHASRVTPLLKDEDGNVRVAAAQALGAIKGQAAADALVTVANDGTQRPALRGIALGALAAIEPVRALGVARDFINSGEPLLRLYVARALATIRTPESFAIARQLAGDSVARIAGAALSSAGAIAGDTLTAARALFIEKLAARDATVRAEAIGGLGKLAQPGDEAMIFDALELSLRDDIEDAGLAAIEVLARMAQKNPAIQRTFATRFPLARIPNAQVQRGAIRQLHAEGTCCQLQPQPDKYLRVFNDLVLPALRGKELPRVRITTENAGAVDVELLAFDAPLTVDNFMTLIRRGYFKGSRWHRVVPNFVLQDGDPTGTGSGGPGYAIRDEINRVRYDRGALGMALSGPDTGGSQFFITHSPQPHLDGGYTVFGRVVAGMENADKVVQDDRILSIEILK